MKQPSKKLSQAAKAPKAKKASNKPKKQKSATVTWIYQSVVDASLEHRPVVRALQPGERQLDFSVQVSHAPIPQSSLIQCDLYLRAVVVVQNQPMLVSDLRYIGVTDVADTPINVDLLHQSLYPGARDAMLTLTALTLHQPPLPATWAEVQQIAKAIQENVK